MSEEERIEYFDYKRYLQSLSLIDLGSELHLLEKHIERCREKGEYERLTRLEKYRKKLQKEINYRALGIEQEDRE